MAGQTRLHLCFNPAIGAGLRRTLEAAFGRLNVETARWRYRAHRPREPRLGRGDHPGGRRRFFPRAAETAPALPDVIAWAGIPYSSETRNGQPHDRGVMTFTRVQSVAAAYHGEFADGKRAGLGAAVTDEAPVSSGQWSADEACGFGILEAPDVWRFKGCVKAVASAAPIAEQGRNWSLPDAIRVTTMHHAVASSLPAPASEQLAPAADRILQFIKHHGARASDHHGGRHKH